jgi:hypothetical protein
MSATPSTLATAPSLNPAVVVIGVLLMWLSWKFEWPAYFLRTPRRTIWGTRRETTREEDEWDLLKTRIVVFLFGLGLVVWHLGSVLGIWDTTPRG